MFSDYSTPCAGDHNEARWKLQKQVIQRVRGLLLAAAIEQELFGWCRHPIRCRERSERMPALNQPFNGSCDYRVPASGRFARGTVLGGDHV